MKKRMALLCAVMVIAFSFAACSQKDSISVSKEDVTSVLLVNSEDFTTKTVEDDSEGDLTAVLNFLNGLEKSENKADEKIGEINITASEKEIRIFVYENGVMIDDILYSAEDFDYDDFYDDLKQEEVSMKR